jgi:hypothetical protein
MPISLAASSTVLIAEEAFCTCEHDSKNQTNTLALSALRIARRVCGVT